MSGLGLLTLGVGNAFSARFYSSCLALEADGRWLVIDCPHPIRKMLREAAQTTGRQLDLDDVAGIALTHLHADHCSGLETLGFYCAFVLGRRMPLLAHPSVAARLWAGHLSAGMQSASQGPARPIVERRFEDFFEWIPLDETASVNWAPFHVRCRLTLHSIPTTALIIEGGGASVGYSADTAFDPDLIEWLSAADLVLHETGEGHLHAPLARLGELPSALRARMRLIHYPDEFDGDRAGIEPLRQGSFQRVVGRRDTPTAPDADAGGGLLSVRNALSDGSR